MEKNKFTYVYVIYDPLLERVVCVHSRPNIECNKCKSLSKKREKEGGLSSLYFLQENKRKLKY